MRAGELDRYISFERKQEVKDAAGQVRENWIGFAKAWARMMPVRGEEKVQAQQTASAGDTIFRLRYLGGITTLDRINHEGKIYDITYIAELGRREGLDITARSRTEN